MRRLVSLILIVIFASMVVSEPVLAGTWSKKGRKAGERIGGAIGEAIGSAVDMVVVVGDRIVYAGKQVLNSVKSGVDQIFGKVSGVAAGIAGGVSSGLSATVNAGKNVLDSAKSMLSDGISKFNFAVSQTGQAAFSALGKVGSIVRSAAKALIEVPAEMGKALVSIVIDTATAVMKVVGKGIAFSVGVGSLVVSALKDLFKVLDKGVEKAANFNPKAIIDWAKGALAAVVSVLAGVGDLALKGAREFVRLAELITIKAVKVFLKGVAKVLKITRDGIDVALKKVNGAISNLDKAEKELESGNASNAKKYVSTATLNVESAVNNLNNTTIKASVSLNKTKYEILKTDSSKEYEDYAPSRSEVVRVAEETQKVQENLIKADDSITASIDRAKPSLEKLETVSENIGVYENYRAYYRLYVETLKKYKEGKVSKDELDKVRKKYFESWSRYKKLIGIK